jgi:type IV pilus assembly protein PilB
MIDSVWLRKFPRHLAEKTLALPVQFSNGLMDVVCANPAMPGLKQQFEELLGCEVRLGIGKENTIRFAIQRAYLSIEDRSALMLGELLVAAGILTKVQLQCALYKQKQTRQKLGEVLQDQGWISAPMLAAALHEQGTASLVEANG